MIYTKNLFCPSSRNILRYVFEWIKMVVWLTFPLNVQYGVRTNVTSLFNRIDNDAFTWQRTLSLPHIKIKSNFLHYSSEKLKKLNVRLKKPTREIYLITTALLMFEGVCSFYWSVEIMFDIFGLCVLFSFL